MFCLLLWLSKLVTLAFSRALSSRRVEQMPSRFITHCLRSSAASSRDETCWPWSSTARHDWSSLESSWLNDVLNSVANATQCSSSSLVIASRVNVALSIFFLPGLPPFAAISEKRGLFRRSKKTENKKGKGDSFWR